MIKLLKASAGSGKTYRLAKTYIGLLLGSEEPHAYRHILAVTFTNKATDEMKRRILKELDQLAREPEKSPYYSDFIDTYPDLAARAGSVLTEILHDYSAFAVSTIDRFVQRTLRAFAREIGQFASYEVELDREALVHESVDRVLDSLNDGDSLLDWLTECAIEGLTEDGKFTLEKDLYESAEGLMSDKHREAMGESDYSMYSSGRLKEAKRECEVVVRNFEREAKEGAAALQEAFGATGLDPSETKCSGRVPMAVSIINRCLNAKRGKHIEKPSDTQMAACGDLSKMFKTDFWKGRNKESIISALQSPCLRISKLFEENNYKRYRTARELLEQVYNMGMAQRLHDEFDALLKEKNVLAIDESNTLLKKIIDGSDAPFVYEKIGVRFEDFLLDEFQDTSKIQWENFEPLLKESNSTGRYNLVVGDIKQCIYRWRGSDWKLLANGVKNNFGDDADEGESLTENWRSAREVVKFNNNFFKYVTGVLDHQLHGEYISPIYSDVEQAAMSDDPQPGSVELTWCVGADDASDPVLPAILDAIGKACERGASYSQIAILVRKNYEGASVASYLGSNGVPVISDDSLSVKSSLTVRHLVSLLAFYGGSGDPVDRFLAESFGIAGKKQSYSLPDLSESLLRDIRDKDPETVGKETLYIQSFMDDLRSWTTKNGNKATAFLKYWKDSDRKIASPDDIDAVRVLTIHKAKGLEFPYVIFPYPEKVGLYRSDTRGWCCLSEERGLPKSDGIVWNVGLNNGTKDTFFAKEYSNERVLQYTDNLNTCYVALTRASKALHVISTLEKAKLLQNPRNSNDRYKDFSQLLYAYSKDNLDPSLPDLANDELKEDVHVFIGEPYSFEGLPSGKKDAPETVASCYESYPLNDPEENEPRLKFRADASDFFDEEGHTGYEASSRIRGTVLHDILSEVIVPSDLPMAVRRAVAAGKLSQEEASSAEKLLSDAIESVRDLGWFPSERGSVSNEHAIISPSGEERRPDRVVHLPDRTVIIDYKFGHPERSYYTQLREYAALYGKMCESVSSSNDSASAPRTIEAWLWYICEPDPAKRIVRVAITGK